MENAYTTLSQARIRFATSRFIMEMRRQQTAAHPNVVPTVKDLESYNDAHKSALMKAVRMAILAASPQADATFARWQEEQNRPK